MKLLVGRSNRQVFQGIQQIITNAHLNDFHEALPQLEALKCLANCFVQYPESVQVFSKTGSVNNVVDILNEKVTFQ